MSYGPQRFNPASEWYPLCGLCGLSCCGEITATAAVHWRPGLWLSWLWGPAEAQGEPDSRQVTPIDVNRLEGEFQNGSRQCLSLQRVSQLAPASLAGASRLVSGSPSPVTRVLSSLVFLCWFLWSIYVWSLQTLTNLQELTANLKKLFSQFHKLCKSSSWGNTRSLLNKCDNLNFNQIKISCQRIVCYLI